MRNFNFAPPGLTEEGRGLFEERYGSGDTVATSQLRVDTTLRRIRQHVASGDSTVDLEELSTAAENYLAKTIDAVPLHRAPDLSDYFHLKIKHAMMRPIVFSESVFADKQDYERRRELVNGLYGSVALILEEAIELFDSSKQKSRSERMELAGIINELTALALLNRRQTPEHLAIPSDITSDLYHATDLEYYMFPKGAQQSRHYHVQVKTRLGSSSRIRTPLGGLVISSYHMQNKSRDELQFPTSRAIIEEVNGTIDDQTEAYLHAAIAHFESHLAEEIVKSDKIHDAYMSLPPRLRNGVERIFRDVIVRAMNENPDAANIIFEIDESELS